MSDENASQKCLKMFDENIWWYTSLMDMFDEMPDKDAWCFDEDIWWMHQFDDVWCIFQFGENVYWKWVMDKNVW